MPAPPGDLFLAERADRREVLHQNLARSRRHASQGDALEVAAPLALSNPAGAAGDS